MGAAQASRHDNARSGGANANPTQNASPSPNQSSNTARQAASTEPAAPVAPNGQVTVVDKPIVVDGGVFDGKGQTFTASSKLGDGGQSEHQQPVFILRNGATLKNVTIGDNGADGIHVYGGANLENVNWKDVGEDALTVKTPGDITVTGGSARNAHDKVFQVNADTNFTLKDFKVDGFTTLVRTNGGQPIKANVTIDGGNFANGVNVFRTDSDFASVNFLGHQTVSNVLFRTRVRDNTDPY